MEIVVFTNGCFDLIHPGHIDLLKKARALGTKLIVGLNSDRSVRAIKGSPRPFLEQSSRAALLKEMRSVDEVRIFDENTPERLIEEIKPDVLVKGGDWSPAQIVGADFVIKNGGKVLSIPFEKDFSSSKLAEKIKLSEEHDLPDEKRVTSIQNLVESSLESHIKVFESLLKLSVFDISRCAELIFQTMINGKKIFFCSDSESSLSLEFMMRRFDAIYQLKDAHPVVFALAREKTALNTQTENSESGETVFSAQIESLARQGDILISIGNSGEIIRAIMQARSIGCQTLGLSGAQGKKVTSLCDAGILIPAEENDRIEEAWIAVGNIWSEILREKIKYSANFQNG